MAHNIEFMDWWKKEDAAVEAVAASLNRPSAISDQQSPDPLMDFAAQVKELAGAAMAEGHALMVASLNQAYAEGFYRGRCEGIAAERKRLRFRAFLAAFGRRVRNAWFWLFVGAVMMASVIALAMGLAQCLGNL